MGSFYKNYLNKFGDNQHGSENSKLTKQDNESHHKYEYKRRTYEDRTKEFLIFEIEL